MEISSEYQSAIKKVVFIVAIFVSIYVSIKYLLPFFAPFVIAIILSYINEPVIRILLKLKMPRKYAALISMLVTMSVLGLAITAGIIKLIDELNILQMNINTYSADISHRVNELIYKLTDFYNALPLTVTETISGNLSGLASKLTSLITAVIQYAINMVSSIPAVTLFIIVTFLATYFISSDRAQIGRFFYRQLPLKWRKDFISLKKGTFKALLGYFKAILILMGFTFVEVSVGLFILDIKYAFLMGVIVGIAEVIPIVGTGVIMAPWILWHAANGNMTLAFGLGIIYVLGILIRQIMEPKIIGHQIGLHPLATLLAMFIGLKLLGFLGMFVGPISVIVVKNLQDAGVLQLWNE